MAKLEGTLVPYRGVTPTVGKNVFIAPGAVVIGRVTLADDVNIWPNVVIRGDVEPIAIGAGTNIQDGSICHVTKGQYDLKVGAHVTVGHGAILHACVVEDYALIGMGAIVLDGATVGKGALVAAGAVVTPRTQVPAGELWAGNPAKKMRDVSEQERDYIMHHSGPHYVALAQEYMQEAEAATTENMAHGH